MKLTEWLDARIVYDNKNNGDVNNLRKDVVNGTAGLFVIKDRRVEDEECFYDRDGVLRVVVERRKE